jgi:octaprenyl-diphosphate synthase
MGKNPGKDLEEGKLTLPLIAALKRADPAEKAKVKSIISNGNITADDFTWVRDFLDRRNGIIDTLSRSREYLNDAVKRLQVFADSDEKRALVRLSNRILHRTY